MNLVNPRPTHCPACGRMNLDLDIRDPKMRIPDAVKTVCSNDCVRVSAQEFVDASRIGLKSTNADAHLHLRCKHCQFTWLEAVVDQGETERAW